MVPQNQHQSAMIRNSWAHVWNETIILKLETYCSSRRILCKTFISLNTVLICLQALNIDTNWEMFSWYNHLMPTALYLAGVTLHACCVLEHWGETNLTSNILGDLFIVFMVDWLTYQEICKMHSKFGTTGSVWELWILSRHSPGTQRYFY